jgi:hypothetical protein
VEFGRLKSGKQKFTCESLRDTRANPVVLPSGERLPFQIDNEAGRKASVFRYRDVSFLNCFVWTTGEQDDMVMITAWNGETLYTDNELEIRK